MKTVSKILILAAMLFALTGCYDSKPDGIVREYEQVIHAGRGWSGEHVFHVRSYRVYESGRTYWTNVFQGTMPEILERNAQLKRMEQFNAEQARR